MLALELDPSNALAWSALGLSYEALGNLRLAEEAYGKAVDAAPRDFQIQDNYAVFLCRRGKHDEAKKYFDKAIKAPTNDYAERTMTNAGVCMMQKPDYAVAEMYFRNAFERRSNHPEALLQTSVLFFNKEDYYEKLKAVPEKNAGATPARLPGFPRGTEDQAVRLAKR